MGTREVSLLSSKAEHGRHRCTRDFGGKEGKAAKSSGEDKPSKLRGTGEKRGNGKLFLSQDEIKEPGITIKWQVSHELVLVRTYFTIRSQKAPRGPSKMEVASKMRGGKKAFYRPYHLPVLPGDNFIVAE